MRMKLIGVLLIFSFSFFGCDSNNEKGIRDSRQGFMQELREGLKENGIPYSTDAEGYIRYSSEHEETVKKIKDHIDEAISREVGTKFEDAISTAYLRKLLDEYKISYRTETRKDGEWTYWRPVNKAQENEIEMKVVTRSFDSHKNNK